MNNPYDLKIHVEKAGYTHPIVKDCSLDIPQGKFCCIVGPNGSGKSTFLKSLLGLLPINEAQVKIGEKPFFDLPLKMRARQISFMLQKLEIDFPFSVEELVSLGRYPHSGLMTELTLSDKEIVTSCLELTGTAHLRERRINELSGGEYQRVLLSKTLVQKTPILLLDEPTAHMDLGHQVQTYELLKKLVVSENKTVLSVCHDLNLAAEYADLIVIITQGSIRLSGSPADTLTKESIEYLSESTCLVVDKNPFTQNPHIYIRPGRSS
ncbi:MAG: ABC transporter ATP-binding protein [Verrucomicrobiota bacterium]|nr:ABC transporter ATP-binding protein [Verrucomicrobiota bacterium]